MVRYEPGWLPVDEGPKVRRRPSFTRSRIKPFFVSIIRWLISTYLANNALPLQHEQSIQTLKRHGRFWEQVSNSGTVTIVQGSDSRKPRNFDLFFCHINVFFCRTRHSNNIGQNLRGIPESIASSRISKWEYLCHSCSFNPFSPEIKKYNLLTYYWENV